MQTVSDSPFLVAILRGVTTAEARSVGECLYDSGFLSIEIPLNSPDPLRSICALREALPANCSIGAGTVTSVAQVGQCHQAGAQMIVSPNTSTAVIAETLRLGLESLPGVATPSEVFAAIGAGARSVKIFPAEQVGFAALKAWTAVIPKEIGLVPVGGVDATNIASWIRAGATGFGVGSSLFYPGITISELRQRAVRLTTALRES